MTTTNTTIERVTELVNRLQTKMVDYTTKTYSNLTADQLEISIGIRYIKIIRVQTQGVGRSVYAFVDKLTGDILKPAGWNAPAKHARGNVNSDDYGISACGLYGVVYLNGANENW